MGMETFWDILLGHEWQVSQKYSSYSGILIFKNIWITQRVMKHKLLSLVSYYWGYDYKLFHYVCIYI